VTHRVPAVGRAIGALLDVPDFGRGKAVDLVNAGSSKLEDHVKRPSPDKLAFHLGIELAKLANVRPEVMSKFASSTPSESDQTAQRGAALAGGALASNVAMGAGMKAISSRRGNPELAGKLLEHGMREHGIGRATHPDPSAAMYTDRHFQPEATKDPVVILGEDSARHPSIVSHELGHAEIGRSRAGRILQNRHTLAMGSNSPMIGAVSGALSGMSDNKYVRGLGVAAPALAAAPQLAYEAGASALGLRNIRRSGGSWGDVARAAGHLAPAFGTYVGQAGMGAGTALLAQGAVRKAREEQAKEAFSTNQYSGAMGPVKFEQASLLPAVPVPGLRRGIEKPQPKFAAALTPAGRLVATQATGKGFGKSPSGPSIASIAKPPRMGTVMAGAGKNVI
jgi:hypothetical protein